jgi:CRISPR-associated protein (TIGR03985 family)
MVGGNTIDIASWLTGRKLMTDAVWSEPVEVPLLQWLVRGPLKQHLPQAVRLWVWLHLLYGSEGDDSQSINSAKGAARARLVLARTFSYSDCRAAFFTASHPMADEKPGAHDANCPCQKSLAAWLFAPQLGGTQAQWLAYRPQATEAIEQWVRSLLQAGAAPENVAQLLESCQPFAVTRRTLASDLKRLCELGWLQQGGLGYSRVATWPTYPVAASKRDLTFLMQPDLAEIAANLSQEIEGQQRFFVHTDYVVPQEGHDRVEDWQDTLRSHWHQSPISPLRLTYWSASRLEQCEVVVYPVCLYYYRRGPYLCGWGEVAGLPDTIDWRNYRLDRIRAMAAVDWQDGAVPEALRRQYERGELPLPEEIELRMSEAWGFDYYRPVRRLLVRFDSEWDERYIRNSLRHGTFERVGYEGARSLIQKTLTGVVQRQMLGVLAARSEQDAYYQALYRHDDPNVRQRLRAWRPHIEVLLPWGLRRRFAQEVEQERRFYED